MKLRYSEAFYSVQGEGKFVGVQCIPTHLWLQLSLYELWLKKRTDA